MSSDGGFVNSNYLTRNDTLQLRNRYIAESCELHFNKNPLKIIRSRGQYLYDEENNEYLDFVSRITNVGHCNEEVVNAACVQMTRLSMAIGGEVAKLQEEYTRQLLDTLPDNFQVVLYTNSGAEANDLALQMVRKYTGHQDLVVVDGAFHGTGNLLVDISPRAFKTSPEGKKPWVHVVPVPDTFRGPYKEDDPVAGELYFQDAKTVITRILANNRKIAGFISEPVFVVHGVLIPPPGWLSNMYSCYHFVAMVEVTDKSVHLHGSPTPEERQRYIREIGGIVIADEIQCGMGRTGNTFWGFESQDAIPDIITVGKPMGNGHPIGAVITSRKIAESIVNAEQIYKCEPVGAMIGMTVLKVMREQKLVENAKIMGEMMKEGLNSLKTAHDAIGDVRGSGVIVGVDIVRSRGSSKPAPEVAEEICNYMKNEKILVACEGEYKNVLLFLPALCITEDDCLLVIQTLNRVLNEIEISYSSEIFDIINTPASPETSSSLSSGSSPQRAMRTERRTDLDLTVGHIYDALD